MRRKLLLILLGVLAALLLAIGGAVLYAGHLMRTPEFRAEFARLLREATGQEVELAGELSVSVFPWLGLRADGVSLGDAPGFGPEPMLTARSLSARVRVLPLISRRLSLDVLELSDASVSLRINAQGVGNWEALVARIRAGEDALGTQDTRFRKVSIRGVRIKGGRARLVDDKRGQAYEITNVSLSTGRIETGRPLAFALAGDFRWERPGLDSRLDVSGSLRWDEAHGRPVFTDTKAAGEIGGDFMPAGAPRAAVSASLSLEDGERSLRVSSLRLHVFGADVTGDLLFVDFLERFEMRGAVHVDRFSPRELVNAYFPQTIPAGHQGALASAEGPVELFANEDEMTFTIPGAKLDGAQVKGKVRLGFGETPGLDFNLSASRLDVDAYHAALSANATGSPALAGDLPVEYLSRVAGQGRITAEQLKLAGIAAQGAEMAWRAAGGTHRVELKPARSEGGQFAGELTASFGGTSAAPVLGFSAGLRLEGAEARQVSWLSRPGGGLSGRMDLRLRGELPKAAVAPAAKLSAVVRRATGEAALNLAPAVLELDEGKPRPGEAPRRMAFSSISAQARLAPATTAGAAPGLDWAVQAEGGFSAVGTKPLLNLDGRFSALARPGQKGGLALSGAAVSGRLKGWFLPKRESEAGFSARGSADFSVQTLSLPQVTAQACGLNLAGSLTGAQVLDKAWTLSGRVRCQDGDPRRVLAALDMRPLKPADRRALTRITGEADLTLSAKGMSLTNLNAQVDETTVRGSYAVQGFDQPRQTFSLQAGALDLDRYRAAPEPLTRRGAKPEPRPAPEPLPVEELRDLALEGSLGFQELRLYGLTARRLKAGVLAKGGTLIVKPLAAEFYGGELSGEIVAQAGQKAMQTRVSLAAKGFQAGGLMLGWAGKEYVTGKADLFVDVGGTGATDTEALRSLEGMAGFKVTDGSYALSGSAEQPRKPPPGATAQSGAPRRPGTPFWVAGAKVKVAGGVFQTGDFRLEGPDNVVTGKGGFSLAEDSINVSLTANMPGVPDVPIKVHGRLRDPEMEVPPGLLINNALKEILGLPLKPIKFFKDLLF